LLNDVLDLERDDLLKLTGMTETLADQLLAFLAELEGENTADAGGAAQG
jgi:hypothetical protein